jgi:hypothetical protein
LPSLERTRFAGSATLRVRTDTSFWTSDDTPATPSVRSSSPCGSLTPCAGRTSSAGRQSSRPGSERPSTVLWSSVNTPTTVAMPSAMPSTEKSVRAGRCSRLRYAIVVASDMRG